MCGMNRPPEPQTASVPPDIRAFVILRQVSLLSTARNDQKDGAFLLSIAFSPLCRFLHAASSGLLTWCHVPVAFIIIIIIIAECDEMILCVSGKDVRRTDFFRGLKFLSLYRFPVFQGSRVLLWACKHL